MHELKFYFFVTSSEVCVCVCVCMFLVVAYCGDVGGLEHLTARSLPFYIFVPNYKDKERDISGVNRWLFFF